MLQVQVNCSKNLENRKDAFEFIKELTEHFEDDSDVKVTSIVVDDMKEEP